MTSKPKSKSSRSTTTRKPRQFELGRFRDGRPLRIGDLMDAIGRRIFGDDWSGKEVGLSTEGISPFTIGSSDNPKHRKIFLELEILDALARGAVSASIRIHADIQREDLYLALHESQPKSWLWLAFGEATPPQRPENPEGEFLVKELGQKIIATNPIIVDERCGTVTDVNIRMAIIDDLQEDIELALDDEWVSLDESIPRPVIARVPAEFWRKLLAEETLESPIDWAKSTLEIAPSVLEFNELDSVGRTALIHSLKVIKGVHTDILWIDNPHTALESFRRPPSFTKRWKVWGKQHLDYSKYFWPEVATIAWAKIALAAPKSAFETQKSLFSAVEMTLSDELKDCPQPSEFRLRDVVKLIYDQWSRGYIDPRYLDQFGKPKPKKSRQNFKKLPAGR